MSEQSDKVDERERLARAIEKCSSISLIFAEGDGWLTDRECEIIAAALRAQSSTAATDDALATLLTHIEDTVSDVEWEKLDPKLWNAVTARFASIAPSATAAQSDYPSRWVMRHNDGKEWITRCQYTLADVNEPSWNSKPVKRYSQSDISREGKS